MTATIDARTSGSGHAVFDAQNMDAAAGPQLAADHTRSDAHSPSVGGTQTSPAATGSAIPIAGLPQGNQLADDHASRDAHLAHVVGTQTSSSGQLDRDPQTRIAAAGPHFTDSQSSTATQRVNAVGEPTSTGGQIPYVPHDAYTPGGFLRDPVIGVLADVLDDLEKVRIANANRVRILTRDEADSDGENRGFGLTEDHPEVAKLVLTVKAMEAAEHDAILNLQRALRKHPLAAFQKRHKGLGEKQFARLLAVLGDPYWNDLHQRPRTVSELWAYAGFHVIRTSGSGQPCSDTQMRTAAAGSTVHPDGHHELDNQGRNAVGVAPKRQRGQQSNWSEDARKRVWVIASAMPKFPGGHYEQVYRAAREKYVDATHPADCMRCGPAGKPALAGSELSDGHKHARAIRIVAKELLKDIWRESRDLYEGEQA